MDNIIEKYNIKHVCDINAKRLPILDIQDAISNSKQALVTVIPSDGIVKLTFPRYAKLVNQKYNQVISTLLGTQDYLEYNVDGINWNCYMYGTIPGNTSRTILEIPVTIENDFTEIVTGRWYPNKRSIQYNRQNFIDNMLSTPQWFKSPV